MPWRKQNNSHNFDRVPSYYANNRLFPGAYTRNESQTRTSRRIHDGFTINTNYGLDTVSDDVNSSPYSSPYYINGRYNSDNLTTQRGNSASVQGTKKLFLPEQLITREAIERTQNPEAVIEMWQGKQIKFWVPFNGKVVGNQLLLKNTDGCTGILSIYFSATPDGKPLYETAIDLCDISSDAFELVELYSMTVVPAQANSQHRLYVRMEIWDEVSQERSDNPFNTGRKIEIAATGLGNHEASVVHLVDKNTPVNEEYVYSPFPNRPLLGLIYSDWRSIPVDRIDNMKVGGQVSSGGARYDIFCVANSEHAYLIGYDRNKNELVKRWVGPTPDDYSWYLMEVDHRATQVNIAQASSPALSGISWTMMYVVDGYSPLQQIRVPGWDQYYMHPSNSGETIKLDVNTATWEASSLGEVSGYYTFKYSAGAWHYNEEVVDLTTYGLTLGGGTPSEGSEVNIAYTVTLGGQKTIESAEYVDARPVVGASLIMFHNNRLYLSGFRNDPNLVQCTTIDEAGPRFDLFPYRFYTPNRNPYDLSVTPITAMVEYASDQIMFIGKSFYSIFRTYSSKSASSMESGMPTQVSTWVDSAGVQSQGDACNYKGVIYSYDQKEGIRRFAGATWSRLPTSVDSHYDRVDMSRPRKLWGFANKLYFNYYDSIDGKAKCLIWDMMMSYQQFPWFQDVDIPFCDARWDESEDIIGIHPDYPMIMNLYAEDTWRRLDTPIVFERHTKYLNIPGNASDFTVNRFHVKVLNNSNRWWWVSLNGDKQNMTQFRGHDKYWRQPVWDTITVKEPIETPFPFEDTFEEDAVYRINIHNIRIRCSSIQAKIKTKCFRKQADLVSVEFEVSPRMFN